MIVGLDMMWSEVDMSLTVITSLEDNRLRIGAPEDDMLE